MPVLSLKFEIQLQTNFSFQSDYGSLLTDVIFCKDLHKKEKEMAIINFLVASSHHVFKQHLLQKLMHSSGILRGIQRYISHVKKILLMIRSLYRIE